MRFSNFTLLSLLVATASAGGADAVGFDNHDTGHSPSGWTCGVNGAGTARWQVEPDGQAPSSPNVLTQRGRAAFAWCVDNATSAEDGTVAVSFKTLSGKEDQAGGVVWRWKDANTYYVARANTLENNVSLYYVSEGVRRTIKYQPAPVAHQVWHRIEVRFHGERIEVLLNGRQYIDLMDRRISGAGKAGVWTKADSVTSFDDFEVRPD